MSTSGFTRLASGLYLEGLALEPGNFAVWYSDVIAGGIHRVACDGSRRSFNTERMWTGGIAINSDGKILSTGAGGIRWTDPASGTSGWLLSEIEGVPINGINEMAPDGKGGLYFGTVDLASIGAGRPPEPVGLYHLAQDGQVRQVCGGLGFTNGLALSADGKTLYCNETFDGTYAHDVAPDGTLSNRRRLIAKHDCDGMALDEAGRLWITGFNSAHIERVNPDGTLFEPFATLGSAVTQIRFGGSEMRDVYLVTVPDDAGAKLAVGDLPNEDVSFLFHGRSDVAGHRVPEIAFDIPVGEV